MFFFNFRPVDWEEMSFKDISYLELGWPFCSVEQNHFCNLVEVIKRNISWLSFVMFNCVFSLSHVVFWVRCGT